MELPEAEEVAISALEIEYFGILIDCYAIEKKGSARALSMVHGEYIDGVSDIPQTA